MKQGIILVAISAELISGCAIIRPGEVGVKQKLGRLSDKVHIREPVFYNPFIGKVIKISVQTNNLELTLNLPSKEGLSINSQISILYKLKQDQVPAIIRNVGLRYETIIANVFRSASADVCAQYYAKELHSGLRSGNRKGH